MSGLNLAAKSKEEQDKVAIDLLASGVAYKERLAMPVKITAFLMHSACRWPDFTHAG